MGLGERIRQARLEKGLSQRQLCGGEITRNMLSQIENGSAKPSMATLQHLARGLEKPISWFLEEETVSLPNRQVMDRARAAFQAGQYGQVSALLEEYGAPDGVYDPERYLLEALSLLEYALQVAEEKPVFARNLLEKARQAGAQTPYFTAAHQRQWVLAMYLARGDEPQALARLLPGDDRELLLRAEAALQSGDFPAAEKQLEAAAVRDPRWHFLRAQAAMGQKDYALAADHYRRAEDQYPQACAKALETCYRELEDYKLAYHYACKQRDM